jgi:hypothetical protein
MHLRFIKIADAAAFLTEHSHAADDASVRIWISYPPTACGMIPAPPSQSSK